MMIILVDHEPDYLDHLSQRLSELIPGIETVSLTDGASAVGLSEADDSPHLIIFNAVEFPELGQLAANGSFSCESWTISPGATRLSNTDFCRIGSVLPLAEKLHVWLSDHPNAFVAKPYSHDLAASSTLHFLFSAEPNGYRPDQSRQRLADLVASHQVVVYLPLMPTYQMSCLTTPSHGGCLSDLLLRLPDGEVTAESIGHYMQPHPDGYLQFRPPDRSDDLVFASPDSLRRLILLIREFIGRQTPGAAALIDCAGLPLAVLARIAVLCDCCEILLPDRACYATDAARREIGILLADLPASCKIIGNTAIREGLL